MLKTKSVEAQTILNGIMINQEAFRGDYDRFVSVGPIPSQPVQPGPQKRPWAEPRCDPTCSRRALSRCESFDCLGFQAAGGVYFTYLCRTTANGLNVTCAAYGDLDGDGKLSLFVRGTGVGSLVAPIPSLMGHSVPCPNASAGRVVHCTPNEL